MESTNILNVRIDNISCQELLEELKKGVLVTPNVDIIVMHQQDKQFHIENDRAEFSICDSRIVSLVSRLTKNPVKYVIPGSSFFPTYCDYHAKNENIKIFLLGAKEGVAEIAQKKINSRICRNIIVGTYSPSFGFENNPDECEDIIKKIEDSGANVVLVGLGNPKQTRWIYKYKDRLPQVDVYMALGATIDFEAGNIKRAPKIIQKLALEWFYRFLKEPKRLFRRYFITDMKFFYYFFLQLIGKYKDPFAYTNSDIKTNNR